MTIEELQPDKPGRLKAIVRRVSGSAHAIRNGASNLVARLPATARATQAGASNLVARLPATARATQAGASNLVARLPATARATQAGARATTSALQQLPDSTLRSLAASSAGLGAGLYLAGKNRLLVALGVVPAIVVGAAIALRPHKTIAPPKSSI
jgi:hypothetical protein